MKFLFSVLIFLISFPVWASVNLPSNTTDEEILKAIRIHESLDGKVLKGDGGKSLGPYHITKGFWIDANLPGDHMDCMMDHYSKKVIKAVWKRYGCRTPLQKIKRHNPGDKLYVDKIAKIIMSRRSKKR